MNVCSGIRGGDQTFYVADRDLQLWDDENILDVVPWFHLQDGIACVQFQPFSVCTELRVCSGWRTTHALCTVDCGAYVLCGLGQI